LVTVTRTEVLDLMKAGAARVAELGKAIEVAIGAQQPTADDLAAITTAADIAKTLADEFKIKTSGAVGKEARIAADFERGARRWSMGCRLLVEGITTPSPKLLAMGQQHYRAGAQAMAEAIQKLS
jgi:hypothetical protein